MAALTNLVMPFVEETFTWKIQGISDLKYKQGKNPHFCVASPPFTLAGSAFEINWYPMRSTKTTIPKTAKSTLYSALYIKLVSSAYKEVDCSWKVSFHTPSGKEIACVPRTKTAARDIFSKIGMEWGWKRTHIKMCDLDNVGAFANNDLTIKFQLRIHSGSTNKINNTEYAVKEKESMIASSLIFSELVDNVHMYSDVQLQAQDGAPILAHKAILACRSPMFAGMFKNNFKENVDNLVEIKELPRSALKQLLLYLYSGRMILTSTEEALILIPQADMHQQPALRILCELYLQANVSCDTAIKWLEFSDLHGLANLKKACESLIRTSPLECVKGSSSSNKRAASDDDVVILNKRSKSLETTSIVSANLEDL